MPLQLLNQDGFIKKRLRFFRIEDSFTRVIYLQFETYGGKGEMAEDRLVSISQATCEHAKQRHYTQTRFDILNGFEIVLTRCINCHKILNLEAKKLN